MSKKKTLCDWNKAEVEKDISHLVDLVSNPKYICTKCARAAESDNNLCKPVKIKKVKKQL